MMAWAPTDAAGLLQWHLDNGAKYSAAPHAGNEVLENLVASVGPEYSAAVEVPVLTLGGGSEEYVDLKNDSAPLLPSGDWVLELDVYLDDVATQYAIWSQGDASNFSIVFHHPSFGWRLNRGGTVENSSVVAIAQQWYAIRIEQAGTTCTLSVDGVVVATRTGTTDIEQTGTLLGAYGNSGSAYNLNPTNQLEGRLSNVRATVGGVTTYIPLQEGGDTNRDIYMVAMDGTYSKVEQAIRPTNFGFVTGVHWTNRRTGLVRDWSIEYGGSLGASGEFVPGLPDGSGNDAEGNSVQWAAGKFSNPWSAINFNPNSVAALTTAGAETAFQVGADRSSGNTNRFARLDGYALDRLATYSTGPSGGDASQASIYFPASWSLRLGSWNTYSGITDSTITGSTQFNAINSCVSQYRPLVLGLSELNDSQASGTKLGNFAVRRNASVVYDAPTGGAGSFVNAIIYNDRYLTLDSSELVPSGAGGDEFARPIQYAEFSFGHSDKRLGVYMVHSATGGKSIDAGGVPKEENAYRRAAEFFRLNEHIEAKRGANSDLVFAVVGDFNDDLGITQFANPTSAASDGIGGLWSGFAAGAGLPTSFAYATYPTRQAAEAGLSVAEATDTAGASDTLFVGSPNAGITTTSRIDYHLVDNSMTITGAEVANSEVGQSSGLRKYSTIPSITSRNASDHKMVVSDLCYSDSGCSSPGFKSVSLPRRLGRRLERDGRTTTESGDTISGSESGLINSRLARIAERLA